jgi:hypothetical protein
MQLVPIDKPTLIALVALIPVVLYPTRTDEPVRALLKMLG